MALLCRDGAGEGLRERPSDGTPGGCWHQQAARRCRPRAAGGSLVGRGGPIIEKLERYLGEHGNVGFACVLLTPDDEGHRAGASEEKLYRARQNVSLELGMVLARLGRRRVAILIKESVEKPSDIAGLIYIPFKERLDEIKFGLVKELQAAGYNPRTDAL